jgi:coenzyme F420-0:L-glutamate ligase / coenzyme F420-1:gamma-L-glutamate ligase
MQDAPPEATLQVTAIAGLPEVQPGDNLAALALAALARRRLALLPGDVLVYTSKIVSKAEGRLLALAGVEPSPFAAAWAAAHGKDSRQVEVVLREARRIVRMDRGLIIAETRHGFVCANAGVDASNAGTHGHVVLLPQEPDVSARRLRDALAAAAGIPATDLAVVISDTFGRPWRRGQTNVAIGAAGIATVHSYAGQHDPEGYELRATEIAVADQLAGATELVMRKLARVPLALVRGYDFPRLAAGADDPGAAALVRDAASDFFR